MKRLQENTLGTSPGNAEKPGNAKNAGNATLRSGEFNSANREIGDPRVGWEIKKLGEVSIVANGGTPKTGVSEYWNGKHLWITPAEMGKRQSPYVENTERKLSDAGLNNSSARLLPPNSVILSSRAPIGHLVINTKPMATNQGCKGIIPNSNLYYTLIG